MFEIFRLFFFFWNVLGFNDMSTLKLVGHFVLSPKEREKRDRRDSSGDEREGQGRKRIRNESEETRIKKKTYPLYPCPGLAQLYKPISVGRPGEIRYTTPSQHPTTPNLGILPSRIILQFLGKVWYRVKVSEYLD